MCNERTYKTLHSLPLSDDDDDEVRQRELHGIYEQIKKCKRKWMKNSANMRYMCLSVCEATDDIKFICFANESALQMEINRGKKWSYLNCEKRCIFILYIYFSECLFLSLAGAYCAGRTLHAYSSLRIDTKDEQNREKTTICLLFSLLTFSE